MLDRMLAAALAGSSLDHPDRSRILRCVFHRLVHWMCRFFRCIFRWHGVCNAAFCCSCCDIWCQFDNIRFKCYIRKGLGYCDSVCTCHCCFCCEIKMDRYTNASPALDTRMADQSAPLRGDHPSPKLGRCIFDGSFRMSVADLHGYPAYAGQGQNGKGTAGRCF